MRRMERIALHLKQNTLQDKSSKTKGIVSGHPLPKDMQENVPILRHVDGGLYNYVKVKGNLYRFRYERVEGKVSGNLMADYDSGWVAVAAGTDGGYDFVHNLGTKILLQQWYFKTNSDVIFDFSSTNHHEMYNTPTDKDSGVTIYMQTANMINVGTADTKIFISSDNMDGGDGSTFTTYTDGYLRCFLWKIGTTSKIGTDIDGTALWRG